MIPAAGRAFGPYRLLRSVATDTLTTTYVAAAEHGGAPSRPDGPRFLVRIAGRFDTADAPSAELVQQFLAQAQRAGAVDHPSILRPTDLGVIDDHPYVATTLVRAVPLGDMLAHGGAINESAALATFAQLAGALDTAHRADVVHGALSPTTIWVGPSTGHGVAYVGYLTGFGAAPLLRDHVTAEPGGGAPVDDILYVAPEQLRGEPITRATDQYSLACALYHTLSGQPPFLRPSRAKLYGAHLMAPPPLLAQDEASAQSIGVALQRGMSKQPGDRYGSCGMLINAALPARDATPPGPPAASAARPGQARRGDRTRALLLAGIGVIVVGIVLWLLLRPPAGGPASVTTTVATQSTASSSADGGTPAATVSSRWSAAVADAPVVRLDVLDGMIVATAEDGTVAGVRPAAGRVRWRADGGVRQVAAGAGTVVYVSELLTALDAADGERRWRSDGEPPTSLHVTGDAVVGSYGMAQAQLVRAVDIDDGSELWRTPAPSEVADPSPILGAGGGVVYALQQGRLLAVDPSVGAGGVPGQAPVLGPSWQIDVGDAWPLLAPLTDGVALVTRDGEVCVYSAGAGSLAWCEGVPGGDREQPTVVGTDDGVVVATRRAVVVLDREMGAPLWSVSPGSTRNLVAVSRAAVVVVGDDGSVSVLDTATGDELLRVPGLGAVTALAAHERWLLVGTADGRIHRFDIDTAG